MLPKATLDFRRDYKLSVKCQKMEDKEGPIAGMMIMYSQLKDEMKPMILVDLVSYLSATEYEEPKQEYIDWLHSEMKIYNLLPPEVEEVTETSDAWKKWEEEGIL